MPQRESRDEIDQTEDNTTSRNSFTPRMSPGVPERSMNGPRQILIKPSDSRHLVKQLLKDSIEKFSL